VEACPPSEAAVRVGEAPTQPSSRVWAAFSARYNRVSGTIGRHADGGGRVCPLAGREGAENARLSFCSTFDVSEYIVYHVQRT